MSISTVYVSVGNSDDKLSQSLWSEFVEAIVDAITEAAEQIYGVWFSESSSPYQNACVAFGLHDDAEPGLRSALTKIRADYEQDSVAWAEVSETEFI